jgi:hypothetical protein
VSNPTTNRDVLNKLVELYDELFAHDGYGEIRIEMKIQRRGQKEVILHCGKQHRSVVDFKKTDAATKIERHQVIIRKPWNGADKSYIGNERRSNNRRDRNDQNRRCLSAKRDFKLERRISPERRINGERRAINENGFNRQQEQKKIGVC